MRENIGLPLLKLSFVPGNELVRESFDSRSVDRHLDETEAHVCGDFLPTHPCRLSTESTALEAMHSTIEHVESFVVVPREDNTWLLTTRETLDELLELIRGCVGGAITCVIELDADT